MFSKETDSMPRERSAGMIVFRKSRQVLYLVLHYEAGHWDFPKGHVEKEETDRRAAMRELEEETGITDVTLWPGFSETIRYFYRHEGKTIAKTVVFFVGETAQETVTLSAEHIGYEWLTYEDALTQLTFDTARQVLGKAHAVISENR